MARSATNVREADATSGRRVPLFRALDALELRSRKRRRGGGWVETGEIADVLGVSVGEAAAALRVGRRLGLCVRRRSLRHGTVWKAAHELSPEAGETGS